MAKKTMRERFADQLLYDLLKLVVIFLFSSSGAIATARLISRHISALKDFGWPVGLATMAIIGVVLYWAIARFDSSKPWYKRIRTDFEIVTKELEYTYISRTELQYVKRITLKARRSGLDHYVDKFNWSGRGTIAISSLIQEQTIEEQGFRNLWRLYKVAFDRPLLKGDEIEVAVKWDLEDTQTRAIPFFSQTVNEPTGELLFLLRLPEAFGIRRVTRTILPSIESLTPISTSVAEMKVRNNNSEIEWRIRKPHLLHCYQISWTDPAATTASRLVLEANEEPPIPKKSAARTRTGAKK